MKVQFEQFEKELKSLNKRRKIVLEQKKIINKNNIDKIKKSIQKEIDGGLLEEFIRKFVDEIIVSKIEEDRYNIKLDIYLNLLGNELPKRKCARHINGISKLDKVYLLNQKYSVTESIKNTRKHNKFNYNVYIETL